MSRSSDDDSSQDEGDLSREASRDDVSREPFEFDTGELVERLPNTDYVPGPDSDVPAAGRLIWVTPGGSLREISPAELERVDRSDDGDDARSCPQCGTTRSVETIVREHPDCGYVGIDGFVRQERRGLLACPKCDTRDRHGTAFTIVATIHSCLRCGQTLDRPLGPRTDGG